MLNDSLHYLDFAASFRVGRTSLTYKHKIKIPSLKLGTEESSIVVLIMRKSNAPRNSERGAVVYNLNILSFPFSASIFMEIAFQSGHYRWGKRRKYIWEHLVRLEGHI